MPTPDEPGVTVNVAGKPIVHVYAEHSAGLTNSYVVYFAPAGSSQASTIKISKINQTKMLDILIPNLTLGSSYDVWILADNGFGLSKEIKKSTFKVVM